MVRSVQSNILFHETMECIIYQFPDKITVYFEFIDCSRNPVVLESLFNEGNISREIYKKKQSVFHSFIGF